MLLLAAARTRRAPGAGPGRASALLWVALVASLLRPLAQRRRPRVSTPGATTRSAFRPVLHVFAHRPMGTQD